MFEEHFEESGIVMLWDITWVCGGHGVQIFLVEVLSGHDHGHMYVCITWGPASILDNNDDVINSDFNIKMWWWYMESQWWLHMEWTKFANTKEWAVHANNGKGHVHERGGNVACWLTIGTGHVHERGLIWCGLHRWSGVYVLFQCSFWSRLVPSVNCYHESVQDVR